jgi:hypothetical protein
MTDQTNPNYPKKFGGFAKRVGGPILDYSLNPQKFIPASVSNAMGKSRFFGTLGRSAAEAIGIDYGTVPGGHYGTNQGFLGAKNWTAAAKAMGMTKPLAAIVTGFSFLAAANTYDMVTAGYAENGVVGAGTGFIGSAAIGYTSRHVGAHLLGSAGRGYAAAAGSRAGALRVALGIGGGALGFARALTHPYSLLALGVSGAAYAMSEYVEETDRAIDRNKQVRGLELGRPIQDQFGTISTLRQRSLNALQNTHVNGRMAFGQEAALLHSSF